MMNEQLFADVNEFARATPWLHPAMLGYAQDGVVLFALLLLTGWWVARRTGRGMSAAVWARVGKLLALAVNQPLVAAVAEARPYTTLHNILVLAAVVTGFARVHIAAHYPQEVLAGVAVGATVALLDYLIVRGPLTAVLRRLRNTQLRPVLQAPADRSDHPVTLARP
jgi:uncharacterized membrane protein YoaK (UPF0700 family)